MAAEKKAAKKKVLEPTTKQGDSKPALTRMATPAWKFDVDSARSGDLARVAAASSGAGG